MDAAEYTLAQFAEMCDDAEILNSEACMLGRQSIDPDVKKEPFKLNALTFLICSEGELLVGNNCLSAGEVSIALPRDVLSISAGQKGAKIMYIVIVQDVIRRSGDSIHTAMPLLMTLKSAPKISLDDADLKDIVRMFDCARLCINNAVASLWQREAAISSVRMLVFSIFQHIKNAIFDGDHIDVTHHSRRNDIYKRFLHLLLSNYKEHHSVQFYADKLFISSKYLSLVIKDTCGKSPHILIGELLAQDAKKRLKETNDSVKEIAYQLNFPNISSFGKFFKRHTNLSPQLYRHNLKSPNP